MPNQQLVDIYRKVYVAFGFSKSYNFPLYVITCGALAGFLLARLQYLDIHGIFFKVRPSWRCLLSFKLTETSPEINPR